MKINIIYLLVAGVFMACSSEQEGNITISGNLENVTNKQLVLQRLTNAQPISVDTIDVDDDGSFIVSTSINSFGFFQLGYGPSNTINLVLEPNDQLKVTGNAANLNTDFTVSGSAEAKYYRTFLMTQFRHYQQLDSLKQELQAYSQNRDQGGFMQTLQVQQKLKNDYSEKIKTLIDNHPDSKVNLAVVEQLDPEKEFDYFDRVSTVLNNSLPNSDYTNNLSSRVEGWRKTAIGSQAPEIALPNPMGEVMKLSELRGSYVLIDFWASWCRPCRDENPNVVRMYNEYKDDGFTVYSVSLDGLPQQKGTGKERWIQAIQEDNLIWPYHVSDLKGWQSSAANLFQVRSIPFSLLVSPEGEIIAKNLRGPELGNKLAELFRK